MALLRRELGSERLLWSPYSQYTEETQSELAIVRAAEYAAALRRNSTPCHRLCEE